MGRPSKLKRAVLKEELVALTGHHVAALILNQLLYWTERMEDVDGYLREEQARQHDATVAPTEGWIYKSAGELITELMLDLSPVTVRRYLALLLDRGWLAERRNPRYPWDRTLQYRVDIVALQHDLAALGFALDDYPLVRPVLRGPGAAPTTPAAPHAPTEPTPIQPGTAIVKDASFKTKDASFKMKDRGFRMKVAGTTVKDRGIRMKDRSDIVSDRSFTVADRTSIYEGAIPETLSETTTEIPANTRPDSPFSPSDAAVVALEALGLSHRQATRAVQRHRLTESEVACWARWRDGLTHVGNPVAVLAATLQQQRLPPGEPRPALRAAPPAATPAAAPVTTPAPHAELWTTVCGRLEHQLGADAYATWIADTSLLAVDDDRVVIGAPNVFVRDHLATAFATPLADAVQAQLGRSVAVDVVIDSGAP